MQLTTFNIIVKATQEDTGGVVNLHLRIDATDRRTAENFIHNWFLQGAGRAIQDAQPRFMDLHIEAEVQQ